MPPAAPEIAEQVEKSDIVTTDEEKEGLIIVRALVAKSVKPERIVMRDAKSYCAILLDDNNRKPICRLWFDRAQKYVGLFDNEERKEERIPVNSLYDLYGLEARLIKTIARYDGGNGPTGPTNVQGM